MPIRYEATTDPTRLHEAAALVQEVCHLTGYPNPAVWTDDTLLHDTLRRQEEAVCIWIAIDTVTDKVVGHGIAEPALANYWNTYDLTRTPWQAGTLTELGALAVHPNYQRQGIAKTLRRHRLQWMDQQGLIACAVAWENVPSDYMCKTDAEFLRIGRRIAVIAQRPVIDYVRTVGLHISYTPIR
jgi:GNAT superfamily N-acetyltransferase